MFEERLCLCVSLWENKKDCKVSVSGFGFG
jgi:hypothetical protein